MMGPEYDDWVREQERDPTWQEKLLWVSCGIVIGWAIAELLWGG